MNKDQVKGKAKEVAGEIQQKAGKLVGNPTQEAKGQAREFEGKMQKAAGDVEEKMKDIGKDINKR